MNLQIQHNAIFNTKKIIEHYTVKDGVPVHYVCTSAFSEGAAFAADIFYRETPHPEFGNHYFGIYDNSTSEGLCIADTDSIETLNFHMILGSDGMYHYSQHRHDYRSVPGGFTIDGGRAYLKYGFPDKDSRPEVKLCTVKGGIFVEKVVDS